MGAREEVGFGFRKSHLTNILFIISFLLFVDLTQAQQSPDYFHISPQFLAVGPNDTNIFRYSQNATYPYDMYITTLCRDAKSQLTCTLISVTQFEYLIVCVTDQAEPVYEFRGAIVRYDSTYKAYSLALFDSSNSEILFAQTFNSIYYFSSFNLLNGTLNYNKTIGSETQFYQTYSFPWAINEEGGVFYTTSSQNKAISHHNIKTGDLMGTVATAFDVLVLYVANNTLLYCSPGQYDPVDGITWFSLAILNPIDLSPRCTFTNTLEQVYSDTKFYYVFNNGQDINTPYEYSLMQFDINCQPLWRFPVTYDYPPYLSYDLAQNWIFLFNDFNLTRINIYDSKDSIMVQVNSEVYDPYASGFPFVLAGVDLQSNIYFWNMAFDQTFFNLKSYNSDLKEQLNMELYPITTPELEEGYQIMAISACMGLATNGILYYVQTFHPTLEGFNYFVAFQTEDSFHWEILSIISVVVLIISFVVAIFLMIKHKCFGADPSGCHPIKLLDLVGVLVTSIALIVITLAICYAQIGLFKTINENTTMFSLTLPQFVDEYVAPCANPYLPPPSADQLCTCSIPSSPIPDRATECISDSCSNSYLYDCYNLLEGSCACSVSLYQYNCDCNYNTDGTCSIEVNSTAIINTKANSDWEICRTSFEKPKEILNIAFYTTIVCGAILLLLNCLQIILLFDSPILDFVITISSLIFAFIQFYLLILGNSYLNNACIEAVMDDLPGCSLVYSTSSNVLTMQSTAFAYLSNAYLHLVSSPAMFIISALPDLLSLFVCIRASKSEHLASLIACVRCRCFGHRGFETI